MDYFLKKGCLIGCLIVIILLLVAPLAISVSIAPYNPHKISINKIEYSGDINIVEKEEYFIFRKSITDTIFVVPKQNEWPEVDIRTGERTYGARHTGHTITLNSNNPDISICYWTGLYSGDPRRLCNKSVTTDIVSIRLRFNDSLKLGSNNSDYEILYEFIVDGSVDGEELKIYGTRYYDNTEESREEYEEEVGKSLYSLNMTNLILIIGVPVAVLILIIIIITFIMRKKIFKN